MTYRPKKGLNSLYVVLGVPRLLEVVVVPVVVTKELDSKMDMKKGEVGRMGEAGIGEGGGEGQGGGGDGAGSPQFSPTGPTPHGWGILGAALQTTGNQP